VISHRKSSRNTASLGNSTWINNGPDCDPNPVGVKLVRADGSSSRDGLLDDLNVFGFATQLLPHPWVLGGIETKEQRGGFAEVTCDRVADRVASRQKGFSGVIVQAQQARNLMRLFRVGMPEHRSDAEQERFGVQDNLIAHSDGGVIFALPIAATWAGEGIDYRAVMASANAARASSSDDTRSVCSRTVPMIAIAGAIPWILLSSLYTR